MEASNFNKLLVFFMGFVYSYDVILTKKVVETK